MNPFTQHTVRNSSPAEIEALAQLCDRAAGFDNSMSLELLDGFLTALVCGGVDTTSDPQTWLVPLFDDSFDRAFADPESRLEAMHLLQRRLKVLAEQLNPEALLNDPDEIRLRPLLLIPDAAELEAAIQSGQLTDKDLWQLTTGNAWSTGFMEAAAYCSPVWADEPDAETAEVIAELLDQIEILLGNPSADEYAAHLKRYYPQAAGEDQPTRDDLITQALLAAQDLRVLAFDRAPRPPTRRVEATPGRNDPCHCGSGKKYKKCHGAGIS
jgi:uncharacterized protein